MNTDSFVFINFANSGVKDFILARVRRATYASLGYEKRVYDSKKSTTNYLTVKLLLLLRGTNCKNWLLSRSLGVAAVLLHRSDLTIL